MSYSPLVKTHSRWRKWAPALCLPLAALCLVTGCRSESDAKEAQAEAEIVRRHQAGSDLATTVLPESGGLAGAPEQAATTQSPGDLGDGKPLITAEIGLPVYPNAQLFKDAGSGRDPIQTGNGINIVLLETPDKPEQVIAFYKEKLLHERPDPKAHGKKEIVHPTEWDRMQDGKKVVTLSDSDMSLGVRTVEVRMDAGRTFIELMNILPDKKGAPPVTPSALSGLPTKSTRPESQTTQKPSALPTVPVTPDTSPTDPLTNSPLMPPSTSGLH